MEEGRKVGPEMQRAVVSSVGKEEQREERGDGKISEKFCGKEKAKGSRKGDGKGIERSLGREEGFDEESEIGRLVERTVGMKRKRK